MKQAYLQDESERITQVTDNFIEYISKIKNFWNIKFSKDQEQILLQCLKTIIHDDIKQYVTDAFKAVIAYKSNIKHSLDELKYKYCEIMNKNNNWNNYYYNVRYKWCKGNKGFNYEYESDYEESVEIKSKTTTTSKTNVDDIKIENKKKSIKKINTDNVDTDDADTDDYADTDDVATDDADTDDYADTDDVATDDVDNNDADSDDADSDDVDSNDADSDDADSDDVDSNDADSDDADSDDADSDDADTNIDEIKIKTKKETTKKANTCDNSNDDDDDDYEIDIDEIINIHETINIISYAIFCKMTKKLFNFSQYGQGGGGGYASEYNYGGMFDKMYYENSDLKNIYYDFWQLINDNTNEKFIITCDDTVDTKPACLLVTK